MKDRQNENKITKISEGDEIVKRHNFVKIKFCLEAKMVKRQSSNVIRVDNVIRVGNVILKNILV